MTTPARLLFLAQLGFVSFITLCALIDPRGLEENHGPSYWGGRGETVVPYLLAFAIFIALVFYAAAQLEYTSAPSGLASGLRLLCLFLVLDVATPDTVGALFYWLHDLTSALLFLYELGFAIWIVAAIGPRVLGSCLLVVQFVGGLVAMFSQLHVITLLGPGILLFQVSFGALLVVAAARVPIVVPGQLEEAPACR